MSEVTIPDAIRKIDPKLARVFRNGRESDNIWLITAPKQDLITGKWTALAGVGGALCLIECTPRFKD
jgi:hypothetical protein